MQSVGIPLPPFCAVESIAQVEALGSEWGYPLMLKARRDGYDGYGNATIPTPDDIQAAWERLGGDTGRLLLAEAFVPFAYELAVMVVRGRDGTARAYPVVETVQQNHICHVVRAPATVITRQQSLQATSLALAAVQAIDGIGVFGVELFLLHDGAIWFNEIAPRPHNSGHYTIEACLTSQFENHLRAILGWPLGDTQLIAPYAVMVNVLGRRNGPARGDAPRKALTLGNAHVHIYGKRESRIGRKMGHVTVLGGDMRTAEDQARRAVELIEL
jgi:5-(carboxyamino)imidazole ribonucleotide synthase